MKEFLSVKLQTYGVQTATLLLKQLTIDTFWNMYQKLAVLKNNILRKKSTVDQLLNKVATLQYTALSFMKETELMKDFPVEALKLLICSQVNVFGGDFFH